MQIFFALYKSDWLVSIKNTSYGVARKFGNASRFIDKLGSNGLVVKVLDFQSRDPVFKTTEWLQGRLSLSSFEVDKMSTRNFQELSGRK